MFEDSLVESQGRIRTSSRWFAIGSLFAQAALLLLFILYPLLHPEALPKQSIARLLTAPLPPRAPAHVEVRHATAPASTHPLPSLEAQLQAPTTIPTHILSNLGSALAPNIFGGIPGGDDPNGVLGAFPPDLTAPSVFVVRPPAPKRPINISSGVASGQLLSPIRPVYPTIAKAARIQGTVVIDATISRQGTIENLRVIDGPPMLRQSAIEAVTAARYRPYLLNGEPVEVQTSVRVIFSLGG